LGTTQYWTPQNRKGLSILGGWSSHGPLIFKTNRNSAGLLWYNHLRILTLEANKGRELLCLLFGDLDTGATKSPASVPWGDISVNKSDIFSHTLGQQISDNLDKCPWVPVGAPGVASKGKPLIDALLTFTLPTR